MYLLNVFLIILSIAGLLLIVFGYQKKSQLTLFFGGLAFISPIFYLISWTVVLPLAPAIALIISFLGKKKVNTT